MDGSYPQARRPAVKKSIQVTGGDAHTGDIMTVFIRCFGAYSPVLHRSRSFSFTLFTG